MSEEIINIMNALEKKEVQVVNAYLKEKWETDINMFIDAITSMRKYNARLADSHLNSGAFVQEFTVKY